MTVHRVARINYLIRTTAFAWCFLVMVLVLGNRGHGGMAVWALLALQFLVYPHLLYLRARFAADSLRAEKQNLFLDPLLLGAWMAMVGFPAWVSYAAVFSTALNNTIILGWRGALGALACFAAGAGAWVLVNGLHYQPETSPLVSALCFGGSLAYSCGVGAVMFGQNRRLRKAREALRAGEQRYRLITEHAADLIAMVDTEGKWLYSSPSYARVLTHAEVAIGADAFARVHEEDQFRVRAAVQVAIRDGESCRLRMRLHTVGGDVRRLETLVHQVREEGAAPRGAVLVSRDVTELRDREEQLEVAAHAIERMAEGMLITNSAGRILTINPAYCQITGYTATEVLGKHESVFRSAMQPQAFYDDLYAQVLRTGYWSGTTWCRRRDGTVYREWRSVSAVRDGEGRVTHFVSLIRELNGRDSGFGGAEMTGGRAA